MIAFIDDHREAHGVEPICKVLPIAPSTYHEHAARRVDPAKLSPRAKRDVSLKVEIRRVFAANFEVYGVRKVWRQLRREGFDIARCTVERLMRSLGKAGPRFRRRSRWNGQTRATRGAPGQAGQDDSQRQGRAVSAGSRQASVPGSQAERPVGL